MKKQLLLSLLFFATYWCNSQSITVDQTTYTVEQLVTDILIDSPCANVSNITFSTGTNFGDVNGIGFFEEPTGTFPFSEGIILTTGNAANAIGPENETLGDGGPGWPGDADLEAAINTDLDGIPGDDLVAGESTNATYIEFEFVPLASEVSFNFVFASEEYGTFQCGFSDAFAFLLTDTSTGVTTNLAIVPGTTEEVSVFTVRDMAHNAGCTSENPNAFDSFYGATGLPEASSPTDFRGYTRRLQALANVTPNVTYTMKLVIADDGNGVGDTIYDAAVFLEAGSFNLGLDLGADLLVTSGNAECNGETVTLDTGSPTAMHTWYLDGVEIMGETGSTLDVSDPGEYTVDVEFSAMCQTSDSVIIEFVANPVANPAANLLECSTTTGEFILTQNDSNILDTQNAADVTITYHDSQADADADVDALTSPYTSTSNPQTIYARIEANANSDCFETTTFEIEVTNVTFTDPISDLIVCDDDFDGFVGFTLTDQDLEVATSAGYTVADVTITYHESQAEADTGMNPQASPYTNTGSPQTIYARLVDNNSMSCTGVIEFDLVVNLIPELQNITLAQCDEDGIPDGLTDYNLTQAEVDVVVGGDTTGLSFSYYLTIADAQTEMNAQVASPFTNTVNPQVVYVRVENDLTGCSSIAEITLDVTATDVGDVSLEECDDDYDGFVEFTLSDADAAILATLPPGLTVAYYETATDAQLEENQLPDNYTNTVPGLQTVFLRVEDSNDCYGIASMDLIVNPLPENNVVDDVEFCSDTPDVTTINDLSQFDADVLGGQAAGNFTITYHESQGDADANTGALASPYTNTSNPQTLYVRIENNTTNCFQTLINFDIIINPNPTLVVPTALEVCDDEIPDGLTEIDISVKNDEIRGGNPNYAITYYLTPADADAAMNQLAIPYTNITNPQTIYARGQDINTGCYSVVPLDLIVEQAPIANTPTPLEYCDPDSDGFGVFTLTDADAEITGGVLGLTVTYHETQADAENAVNALSSPYNNIMVDTQTLYARVESATITTDCATIVELILIVHPDPQIELDLTPLEECDDDTDEITQFDLTEAEAEVLNGIDPTEVTVSYYETEANAEASTNAIAAPTAYSNITNPQTVWIRVEYNTTGCYKITSLELIVNPLPVLVQPDPLELCDVNNPGDEMEAFTLEDANAQILNGQTGISLTYYETQADADANANPIASPYVNTSNPQTIYVRAENDVTSCVSTITLDLRVNPLPTPATPDPLEICDDDNDGFGSFDLELRTLEIINGELNVSVTYHETFANAELGQDALTSPYDNIVADMQTVYARAENGITGCFAIVELVLIVQPSPEVPLDIEDFIICDDDNDGFTQFDLTEMDAIIYGGQDITIFDLSYHLTQADADTGANPIVNVTNYTNLSNPQTIYVRLVSVANGCVTTGEFDLVVALPPVPVQPTPLEICDDDFYADSDEIATFDLTVKDAEITGGNASWIVTYYETDADAQADMNAIDPADAYMNTSVNGNPANPQTLYVRVTDTDTDCFAFTTLTIRVLPNPTPSQDPNDIELCDDTMTGDGLEVFDLTINEAYIINGEVGVTATYHETPEDADAGMNAIADPALYTNIETPSQTIYVRVTNDTTGCFTIVTFNIIVNPLPDVIAVTDYILCEINTDGVGEFDLESKTSEILNGQDPGVFVVTYHESAADAQAALNALVSPYTNLTNPQQIFVNITNTATGCDIATVSFNIEVQEGAEANSDGVPILYEICDDNVETDGDPTNDSAQFDLTTQDAALLDGQDPANYTVSYYATEADAELMVNPLPTLYENIVNPQVIYARVDNDTTVDDICYAVAELTLQVNPLPIVDLEDEYILCVDINGSEVIDQPILETGLSETDYSFEWLLDGTVLVGETSSSLVPTQGGSYTVVVTDITSSMQTMCSSEDTAIVTESGPPVVTAVVSSSAFANSHVIEVTAVGSGVYEYSLDNGPWQESNIFTDVTPGEHEVMVRDVRGCGVGVTTVQVIDYPLFFTPNGDGYHDTWNIISIANQPNAKIYIFDRYGKLLKQISPTGQGWDGTYNGEPMPSSDYWFSIQYNEPLDSSRKQFKAHFTLKR